MVLSAVPEKKILYKKIVMCRALRFFLFLSCVVFIVLSDFYVCEFCVIVIIFPAGYNI